MTDDDFDVEIDLDEPDELADVDEQARSAVAKIEQLVASGEYSEAAGAEARRIALEAGRLRAASTADAQRASQDLIEAARTGQVVTAATLMDEEELPPQPGSEIDALELEADTGEVVVVRDRGYGAGYRIYRQYEDGVLEPLGLWLERELPPHAHDGESVYAVLTAMGLEHTYALEYSQNRDKRRAADAELAAHPAVQTLAREEQRHVELKDEFSRRFVAEQKKKAR